MFGDELRAKVDRAILLEQEIKEKKKQLESLKAELQTEALAVMENRNLKWKQLGGEKGVCSVAYKEELEIDSLSKLAELCGDLAESKITVKQTVTYEVDSNFKRALIALYKGDYREVNLPDLLENMGLLANQVKLAMKRLKGDYIKDKALLESFGKSGSLEEELDPIHDQRNFELVSRYFDVSRIDEDFLRQLRLAISVEDGLSIGFNALGGIADEQAADEENAAAAS